MKEAFFNEGLTFGCTRCNNCCRHESGYVFLSKADLGRLCDCLGITEEELLLKYCKIANLGVAKRVSLIEKSNKDCIFWQDGCTVYEGRPLQCRTYPFWPQLMESRAWQEESARCPGVGQGYIYNTDEIQAILSIRENEPLIDLSE